MTPQEINEFLATEVMGYFLVKLSNEPHYWAKEARPQKGVPQCIVLKKDWNPHENDGQAIKCAIKMRDDGFSIALYATPKTWRCFVAGREGPRSAKAPTPSAAICEAIVKALFFQKLQTKRQNKRSNWKPN